MNRTFIALLLLAAPWTAASAQICAERRLTDASGREDNSAGYSYPRFLKSGDRVAYVGPYASSDRLFRHDSIDLAGGTPVLFGEAPRTDVFYRANPAIHDGRCAGDLCVADTSGSVYQSVIEVTDRRTKTTRLVSVGQGNHRVPVITPDGKLIVFSYNSRGNDDIFSLMTVGVDGSNPRVLVDGESARQLVWLPAVSPDGKLVAYAKRGAFGRGYTKSDIFLTCLP